MKRKTLLIFTAIILSVSAVNAQEVGTKFGLKIGLNSSNFGGDGDTETIFGFHGGPYVHIGITEKFAIQPELLYSTQGAEVSANNANNNANLSYLNLPIMAKIYVADGFNIQVGPYIGVLLDFDSGVNNNTANVRVGYKGFDYGVGLGLAYELDAGFNFGGRYNFGLADVSDVDTFGGGVEIEGRTNRVFQLFIGYTF